MFIANTAVFTSHGEVNRFADALEEIAATNAKG